MVLDPWQKHVLANSLLVRDGRWAAFEVGLCCPRQNGKNALLEARELAGLFVLGERLLIHSAHLADTAKEAFRRLEELIDANDWLSREVRHVWRTNGHEAIELMNGQRIRFRTRTKGGGRGFSADFVAFDEAMVLPETSLGAILPVVSARPNPQLWYTGSAVDQMVHDDGTVFARVRNRGLTGDPGLYYAEFSVDADNPDDLLPDVAASETSWAAANPGYGIRILRDTVSNEFRSMDPRTFAVERLGVGDWPVLGGDGSVISLAAWNELADGQSEIAGKVCFAFDVTPDRSRAAVAACGRRSDGLFHVEVVDRRAGTDWIVGRLLELRERHRPTGILCDSASPAASLVSDLEKHHVEVSVVAAGDHAKGCGMLFDAVEQKTLRHLGTQDLQAAIRGAVKRPLGDGGWGWSRKNSGPDISPLVASTLAFFGASTLTQTEILVAFG